MYNYLKGKLTYKSSLNIVVECRGVGYDVNIPLSTYDKLPEKNSEIKILIHFSMSDDGIRLFGFISESERTMFRELISISRVGPKIGLSILSGMAVDDIIHAIITDNVNMISTIPGIGKKSAQRLIIELKDKVGKISASNSNPSETELPNNMLNEAQDALITLGYSSKNVAKVINQLRNESTYNSSEELIKLAIKKLYSNK